MSCQRRLRLEQKHTRAGERVADVRERIHDRIGICSKGEFLALTDELDRVSEVLEHARAALDQHIQEHCCLTLGSAGADRENA